MTHDDDDDDDEEEEEEDDKDEDEDEAWHLVVNNGSLTECPAHRPSSDLNQ